MKNVFRIPSEVLKIGSPRTIALLPVFILFTALQTNTANAFCGFYVAKADASLFNKTSQVILVRDGNKTTITMSSDFEGDVKDFAMVVPVPVVLKRNEIRTVNAELFQKLDAYSGPRLVEYFDENPCAQRIMYDQVVSELSMAPRESLAASKMEEAKEYKVKIEAQYTVDEYDVILLSAEESGGLEKWLTINGYKIPEGAREVLQPYINSNMKFFVVKVNMAALEKKGTRFLSPLQITFDSPKFMLPIRLGMVNAKGAQDMIIYAFTSSGRVETTNYRTLKVPTDKNIPVFVQNYFGQFYVDTYRKHRREQGTANVYLEYAWDLSGSVTQFCDPCTGNPPMLQDLVDAGVNWVQQYHYGYNGNVFFTRLHVTYDRKNFPQDLQFQVTPNRENFQARYIITHPAYGEFTCDEGQQYLEKVRQRRSKELQQLAMLTGWETYHYGSYVNNFNFAPDEAPKLRKVVAPIKPVQKDSATNFVPLKDPDIIEQGSFGVPFEMEDNNHRGDQTGGTLIVSGIALLLLLLVIAGKKNTMQKK